MRLSQLLGFFGVLAEEGRQRLSVLYEILTGSCHLVTITEVSIASRSESGCRTFGNGRQVPAADLCLPV
ncbi:MAG: hypothetical protein GY772_33110 [bacterium]|nr:hypothetical protein [bacterium]